MATQYTAGLSAGQILTAATMNQIGAASVTYTPTFTQSATITKTINIARYWQVQKFVIVQFSMTATSSGTAGNAVLVGLPLTALSSSSQVWGAASFTGGASHYGNKVGTCYGNTTTTMSFLFQDGVSNLFGVNPSFQILSGDNIAGTLIYEVA